MAKKISIAYNDKTYTLEFNRATVSEMEREGFDVTSIDTKPMTLLPKLFSGAFRMHHRFVKQTLIDEIFDSISNKDKLIAALAELYNEPMLALLSDPEDKQGNATWEKDW